MPLPFSRDRAMSSVESAEEEVELSKARQELLRQRAEEAQLKQELDRLHPGWRQKLGDLAKKTLNADTLRQLKRGLEKSGSPTHSQNNKLNPVPQHRQSGGVNNPSMVLPPSGIRRA